MEKTYRRIGRRLFCIALSVLAAMICSAGITFAADTDLTMVEGEVVTDFAAAETTYDSEDPSIAWVDENGSLNAMKEGTVKILATGGEDDGTVYNVTVSDYTDGSEIVGKLKLLVRYNDSMQFYDGHTYLLFTSYQDGVEIKVDDLYSGYEVDDQYYKDIAEDIANGSNHTGSDAEKYFTENRGMTSMTLDRGEAVSIGMYRDFDLSVPQAALGVFTNSSVYNEFSNTAKAQVAMILFDYLDKGKLSSDEAIAALQEVFAKAGEDPSKCMDGIVDGGICFNRELYNQKLEWDQYENVTYEMDITRKQLETLEANLAGNLNKFNIMKNSCVTAAFRAWNASVGTRDGERTAYWLDPTGEGIFAYMDAPKGARDEVVSRLPGYYLNNAEGVEEPDAGFEDETGYVYVSAPEPVAPLNFKYSDDSVIFDASANKMADLIAAAKGGDTITYDAEAQDVGVEISTSSAGGASTIDSAAFTINSTKLTLNKDNVPEDGIWFSVKVNDPEGDGYYVTDGDGNILPSEYAGGSISFLAEQLPVTYKIMSDSEKVMNVLKTTVSNPDEVEEETEVYYYDGEGKKVTLGEKQAVAAGTEFFVKAGLTESEFSGFLNSITLNGEEILSTGNYDEKEGAFLVTMPAKYSKLKITYRSGEITTYQDSTVQLSIGDTMAITDYADLTTEEAVCDPGYIKWFVISDPDEILEMNESGSEVKVNKTGEAVIWAGAKSNENLGEYLFLEVYENTEDMVSVLYDTPSHGEVRFTFMRGDDEKEVAYSGYLVEKGTELNVVAEPDEGYAVSKLTAGDQKVAPGDSITVSEDTDIEIKFKKTMINGVPDVITLDSKDDTYQIDAKVKYSGLSWFSTVYDESVSFTSSNPLVNVDETGLVTVTGDIPEEGKLVMLKITAGSSNDQVSYNCKVTLGDYEGSKIVGKLTIWARPVTGMQLIGHGAVAFQTYEDLDMNVSYYNYFKPEDKYTELLMDYDAHPEKYAADPAIISEEDLEIEDRASYFTIDHRGAGTDPVKVSLKAGESVTVSSYGYENTNLITILKAIENGQISLSSESAQELAEQINLYLNGEEYDGGKAFDSLLQSLIQAYAVANITGHNPMDGTAEGGINLNREVYNQFIRAGSQLPNSFHSVEITADEYALLEQYLSDPANNYYSLVTYNCTTSAVDIWNTVLADREVLKLTGNYSGFSAESESLYFELLALQGRSGLSGVSGKDFYPRSVPYTKNSSDSEGDGTKDNEGSSTNTSGNSSNTSGSASNANSSGKDALVTAAKNIKINAGLKVRQTGKVVKVKWGKVPGAAKYKVYAAYCGSGSMKLVGTVTGKSLKLKKLNGKKLNLKKNMKVRVYAEDKDGNCIAKSLVAHVVGRKNAKYTNPKKVKVTKKTYKIKKGKKAKIKAKIVLVDKNKKGLTKKHARTFRYASTNTKIATVTKKGVIKAKSKGTCYVYVYARNGFAKKVKVKVR